jgi:hypothetical protein
VTGLWPPILTTLGVIIVGYLTYLASRRNKRSDAGQQMIDQHQEDIKELRAELVAVRARQNASDRIQRIQGDYIGQLRQHIVDRRDPPPPPYPPGLIT